jgi:hypothetical protein
MSLYVLLFAFAGNQLPSDAQAGLCGAAIREATAGSGQLCHRLHCECRIRRAQNWMGLHLFAQ